MRAAFVAVAKDLVREGAAAITTNCGFTIKYQSELAEALAVPVSLSSLLLLPYILSTIKGRVGIVTFDSRPLMPDVLKCSGISDLDRIAIRGIEHSPTWSAMSEPENKTTIQQMAHDVLTATAFMRSQYDDIQAILFECAGFTSVTSHIRAQTRLPIFDAVTNAKLLMAGHNLALPSG
ncbi:hypothetical protein NKH53_31725 [Mesorhizobium australicum]|uniref:hypothetical protein n=1 Tax=Mesorhizobium australicum TaxID=536018 RepID=UPI00333A9405